MSELEQLLSGDPAILAEKLEIVVGPPTPDNAMGDVGTDLSDYFNNSAANDPLNSAPSIEAQSNHVDMLIGKYEDVARQTEVTITELINAHSEGLSAIEGFSPSKDDIMAMKQGYNNMTGTIELPDELLEQAELEAVEMAADIQFMYDLGRSEAENLSTMVGTQEEIEDVKNQLEGYKDILLAQVEAAQNFSTFTNIEIEMSEDVLKAYDTITTQRSAQETQFGVSPDAIQNDASSEQKAMRDAPDNESDSFYNKANIVPEFIR